MKQTIVVLGLIASTSSLFLLPGKTLAEKELRSHQTPTTMAIRLGISQTAEADYTGTDEDGNREEVTTEEKPTSE